MKKIMFAVGFSLFIVSCGGSGESNVTDAILNSSQQAVKSLPQITGTISSASVGVDTLNFTTDAGDTDKIAAIQDFFKLECHDSTNTVNFCPSGVTASDSNKFTASTLIGLIYLAEMKGKDIYNDASAKFKTCESGVTHSALTNHIAYYDMGGGPATTNPMVLPFGGSLLDCVSTFDYTSGSTTNTTYSAYSKATDGNIFAFISSRKGDVTSMGTMSDVFQGYMSKASGNPAIVAFNLGSYNEESSTSTYVQRVVLIVNVADKKFAVKKGDGINSLMAMGKAGYDPSTGTYTDGYFVVRVLTNTAAKVYCIKNAATPTVVAGTYCSDIVADMGTTTAADWTASDVATYLGLSSTDETNIAAFITGDVGGTWPTRSTALKNTIEISYPEVAYSFGGTYDDTHFPDKITAE